MRSTIVEAASERVHTVTTGPPDGAPVLVTSGLGGAWFDWRTVVERLSDLRLTVVDRPGLGLSPAGRAAPSLRRDAAVLIALAERMADDGPVTLVAHSMGAFHAEAAARLRPDVVRGLVLVDPSVERDPGRGPRLAAAALPVGRAAGALLAATGLPWLLAPHARRRVLGFTAYRGLPVPDAQARAVYGRGTVLATLAAEWLAYYEQAADLASLRARRRFPSRPLTVLTASGSPEWNAAHAELVAFGSGGEQIVLPDSRHMIMIDRPDAIADAVREVAR